jgi:hypothetical protein
MQRHLSLPICVLVFAAAVAVGRSDVAAQRGAGGGQRGAGAGGAAQTARARNPVDFTGTWVSVVTEDWRWRMVTAPKDGSVAASIPVNGEGRKVAQAWDVEADNKAGNQCKAFGVGGITRQPGRVRISWQDDNTLKLEYDAGTQTRLLHFGAAGVAAATAAPSWQGQSVAQWEFAPGGRGATPTGNLKVVTTNLRAGYVRKNGAPHSDKAVVTEYFDVNTIPNGDAWLTITTKVEDPVYFSRPYITTTDFKKLPGAAGWSPTPCSAK